MEKVIEKFKDIVGQFGYRVIELQSCSEQDLKRIMRKHGNGIKRVLILIK